MKRYFAAHLVFVLISLVFQSASAASSSMSLNPALIRTKVVAPLPLRPRNKHFTEVGSGTYNTPPSPAPTYIKVRLVGGGGGGGTSATSVGSRVGIRPNFE